jgi:hypothetical protein
MARIQQRRTSARLRIEHHTITIHYLINRNNTSFSAADLVTPKALVNYRRSKGKFCLSWRILMAKLREICEFDVEKHVLVS